VFRIGVVFMDDKNQCICSYNSGEIKHKIFNIKDTDGVEWIFPLFSVRYILIEKSESDE
jgi:hypothetical protein